MNAWLMHISLSSAPQGARFSRFPSQFTSFYYYRGCRIVVFGKRSMFLYESCDAANFNSSRGAQHMKKRFGKVAFEKEICKEKFPRPVRPQALHRCIW